MIIEQNDVIFMDTKLTHEQNAVPIPEQSIGGLDWLKSFQGLVDEQKELNLLYGFRLGKINIFINELMHSEVVKKPNIYPIPSTPSWVEGLINLHGMLVPVFDIKNKLLQQHDPAITRNTLLVLNQGESAFALFIDDLPITINRDHEDFRQTAIPDNPPEELKNFITDAFLFQQDIWLAIDYHRFIGTLSKNYSDYQADD